MKIQRIFIAKHAFMIMVVLNMFAFLSAPFYGMANNKIYLYGTMQQNDF